MLGVDVTASSDEIREAFRRRARAVHPDTAHGDDAAMVELNVAYETLAARTGPDWQFAGGAPNTPWATEDPAVQESAELGIDGDRSLLRYFGIALAVVSVVTTTFVFVAAVGYDWSLSP